MKCWRLPVVPLPGDKFPAPIAANREFYVVWSGALPDERSVIVGVKACRQDGDFAFASIRCGIRAHWDGDAESRPASEVELRKEAFRVPRIPFVHRTPAHAFNGYSPSQHSLALFRTILKLGVELKGAAAARPQICDDFPHDLSFVASRNMSQLNSTQRQLILECGALLRAKMVVGILKESHEQVMMCRCCDCGTNMFPHHNTFDIPQRLQMNPHGELVFQGNAWRVCLHSCALHVSASTAQALLFTTLPHSNALL